MKSQVKFELFIGLLTSKGLTVSTEQVNEFKQLFSDRLESCNIVFSTGIWKGNEEPAIVLTHIGEIHELETIKELARIAKVNFKQDAVLISCTQVSTILIEDEPKKVTVWQLKDMSKEELIKTAQSWGLAGAILYKEAELRQYIDKQMYLNQGLKLGAIGTGVGLK